jgi:hypothetical protein
MREACVLGKGFVTGCDNDNQHGLKSTIPKQVSHDYVLQEKVFFGSLMMYLLSM